ncbi:MAG TPA: translocation and assembly module protein TamB, partial [Paracoccaceae bacterium]|nr:translocation and assembly module protein TamB [Paracoccaceae bacterium]
MRALILAAMIALPLPVLAQEAERDRDRLTAFLEDNLSDVGRSVVVTGFTGALSSRAAIERLTIADADGIWLTLNGVVLDWNRAAVLGGRISVNELVAEEVVIDRPPRPAGDDLPAPEAGGFALPELPVSVEIGRVAAARIVLGPAVLGQAIEGSLEAALNLSGGEGRAQLAIRRTDDGPDGQIDLTASYANASGMLVVDLAAREGAGGIAASLLDLPGQPAADLTIKGSGPLTDFAADVRLATAGQDRLTGRVSLRGADGAQGFAADLSGDLAPLFVPEYAEFFGPSVRLVAQGTRAASGRLDLPEFALETRALTLTGAVVLAAGGLPERFDVTGRLGLADGSPVLLPLPDEQRTRVTSADLRLRFDAAAGEGWSGDVTLRGLDRADFGAAEMRLTGSGRIARPTGAGAVLGATLEFDARGLRVADPGLAQALGEAVTGEAKLFWQEGVPGLRIARAQVNGADFAANLRGRIEGLATGFRVAGAMDLRHDDVSRLSGLAGRPLSGAVSLTAQAEGSPLGGDLDLTARIAARDLTLDQPEADRLLAGESAIALSVLRDDQGTTLRDLTVTAGLLRMVASGTLATAGSDLVADLTLPDLAAVNPVWGGGLTAQAQITGPVGSNRVVLSGTGEALRIGQPEADRLLRGTSAVNLDLRISGTSVVIADARLATPQVTAFAQGALTGPDRRITLDGRLSDLSLLIPEFPGPVTVTGAVAAAGDDHAVTLRAQGPGQIDARVEGTVSAALDRADLAIRGSAQAALANPFLGTRAVSGLLSFDARLNGPPVLSSVSG